MVFHDRGIQVAFKHHLAEFAALLGVDANARCGCTSIDNKKSSFYDMAIRTSDL